MKSTKIRNKWRRQYEAQVAVLFPWAHQANKKSRVVPVDGLESDSEDVFYCDVHLEIIRLFFFCPVTHNSRIRMECPRGVTIIPHVFATSQTCIRRFMLRILPAKSCFRVLIVATFHYPQIRLILTGFKCCCWYAETKFRLFLPSAWMAQKW